MAARYHGSCWTSSLNLPLPFFPQGAEVCWFGALSSAFSGRPEGRPLRSWSGEACGPVFGGAGGAAADSCQEMSWIWCDCRKSRNVSFLVSLLNYGFYGGGTSGVVAGMERVTGSAERGSHSCEASGLFAPPPLERVGFPVASFRRAGRWTVRRGCASARGAGRGRSCGMRFRIAAQAATPTACGRLRGGRACGPSLSGSAPEAGAPAPDRGRRLIAKAARDVGRAVARDRFGLSGGGRPRSGHSRDWGR